MTRGLLVNLAPETGEVRIASPEDIVLRKLEWYRTGGEVSDRQWQDILGVLKVQGPRFDVPYATRVAAAVRVEDLLRKALAEAGRPVNG